jgi:phosphoribosyl-ATP pyrophosphohydrolase
MEERDMAALVRHETAAEEAVFPAVDDALDYVSGRDNPRTAPLLACGRSKIAQKLIEEAGELALEAVRHRSRSVVRESADLGYQLVVLWHECGIAPGEVWAEMRRRADKLGIAEKLPNSSGRHTSAAECGG